MNQDTMTNDTLYRVGPGNDGPIVRRLRAGTWPGFELCQVVHEGIINKTKWAVGTLPHVPVGALHEVDQQTTLPGLDA